MRQTRLLLCYLLAAITIAGCTDQSGLAPEGYEMIEITANHVQMASRTQIDTESANGVTGLLWSVGDSLGVFGSNGTANAIFTGDYTRPQASATFTGSMKSGDTPKYAYYPYTASATDAAQVPVTVRAEQMYADETSIAESDIKVSTAVTESNGKYHFTFQTMVAMLRFEIDASGVAGLDASELLQNIQVKESDNTTTASAWVGGFTMNLSNPSAGLTAVSGATSSSLEVNLQNQPALSGKVVAYACVAPAIKKGDALQVYLNTDKHRVGLKVSALQDVKAGGCYDVPLYLSKATADNSLTIEALGEAEELPEITEFTFRVSENSGKILAKEVYYNGSKTTVKDVTEQALTIDSSSEQISGCIPYLYNFQLTPVFTTTEGATVTVGGETQVSGQTQQDFSSPVTYTVTKGTASRNYTVTVTNTGLPVVVLTQNATGSVSFLDMKVPAKDGDWGDATLSLYDKDTPANDLANVDCGFRLRGNSTQTFPKKPFAIKFDKKQTVLGMPEHKRWCLLANWIDRSLIRNGVAFAIADKVKNAFSDGLTWQPSGKSVELVINGRHVGTYFLCEQIKIGSKRLNIQDGFEDQKNPTSSNCGYLLEFDDNYDETNKFVTTNCGLPCMSKDEITDNTIWNYVKNWVQDIEDKLVDGDYTSAYNKLDKASVVDYWIIQELTMNNEYRHPKSVYMYKDGEGKLFAGPVWDFDYQTFPNITNINSKYSNGGQNRLSFTINTLLYTQASSYLKNQSTPSTADKPYMWYPLLFKDANFKALVKTRWTTLYPLLQGITATITELGDKTKLSDSYNQAMWPITGKERTGFGWFIDYSGDEEMTYSDAIENMKTVYTNRLNAMNSIISNW